VFCAVATGIEALPITQPSRSDGCHGGRSGSLLQRVGGPYHEQLGPNASGFVPINGNLEVSVEKPTSPNECRCISGIASGEPTTLEFRNGTVCAVEQSMAQKTARDISYSIRAGSFG
jgi:hypothetical protein